MRPWPSRITQTSRKQMARLITLGMMGHEAGPIHDGAREGAQRVRHHQGRQKSHDSV